MDKTETTYEFILNYKTQHGGASPTVREVMEGLGLKSTSAAYYRLALLQEYGRIKLREGNLSRGIVIPGEKWLPPEEDAFKVEAMEKPSKV